MKRGLSVFVLLSFILILSLTFVSAGLFSDIAGKITGKVSDDTTINSVLDDSNPGSFTNNPVDSSDSSSSSGDASNPASSSDLSDSKGAVGSSCLVGLDCTSGQCDGAVAGACSGTYNLKVNWLGNPFDWDGWVSSVPCEDCHDAGQIGYFVKEQSWFKYTCVQNKFIFCVGARWSEGRTFVRYAYTPTNCNTFSSQSLCPTGCSWTGTSGVCKAVAASSTCTGSETQSCIVPNGTGIQNRICDSGTWSSCTGECNLGYANCDTSTVNGCETKLGTNTNCALCENACSSGQTCQSGVCKAASATACTGLNNQSCSISNGTGVQSRICDSGTWSSWSSCAFGECNLGYANCDASTANGCETKLGENAHCASCINACVSGQTCQSGICTDDSAITAPASPVAMPATNIVSTSFTANWKAVTGATDYVLDVALGDPTLSSSHHVYTHSVGDVTSQVITGLTANTNYYYRVNAWNGELSIVSNLIQVKTSVATSTPDLTPRVAFWAEHVNQYVKDGVWTTAPDGIIFASSINFNEAYRITVCKKFYGNGITSSPEYKSESITTWMSNRNVNGPFTYTVPSYKCVQGNAAVCNPATNPTLLGVCGNKNCGIVANGTCGTVTCPPGCSGLTSKCRITSTSHTCVECLVNNDCTNAAKPNCIGYYCEADLIDLEYPVCGDGIINQANETCDDHNTVNNDGCSSFCTLETGWKGIGESCGSNSECISGNCSSTKCSAQVSNSIWNVSSTIVNGLPDIGALSRPTAFYKDSNWYIISGGMQGKFYGFVWDGTQWIANSAIINGLPDIGGYSAPSVFYKDSSWYLISGEFNGKFYGFVWDGTQWIANSSITQGLPDVPNGDFGSTLTVFYKDSNWYLISEDRNSKFYGYSWNGTKWLSNSTIINGLPDLGNSVTPMVFYKDSNWYLISGMTNGKFYSYSWNGTQWKVNLIINASLLSVEVGNSAPFVFNMSSTDWYIISGSAGGGFYGYKYDIDSANIPLKENGGSCSLNSECASGNCTNSICSAQVYTFTQYANSTINASLPDIGNSSAPTIFYKDSSWYMISGEAYGDFYGFVWDGTQWKANSTINASLPNLRYSSKPFVFYKDSSWYLISGNYYLDANGWPNGKFYGFVWDNVGNHWHSNSIINASLPSDIPSASPSIFQKDGKWYLISGSYYGTFFGFVWNGTNWVTDLAITNSLPDVGFSSTPTVFYKDSSWHLISGSSSGLFFGFVWDGIKWLPNSTMNASLPVFNPSSTDWPLINSAPFVFNISSTDWYLISGNAIGGFYGYKYDIDSANIPLKENGGSCSLNSECASGNCTNSICSAQCTPSCVGKQCGSNGCGGTCGNCSTEQSCVNNICKIQEDTLTLKRIAFWEGKVNQHTENGVWTADSNEISDVNVGKLNYCKKFYPNTLSVRAYQVETIPSWKSPGSTGAPISAPKQSYECVQSNGATTTSCEIGCSLSNGRCVQIGYRQSVKYCSPNGDFVNQIVDDAICDNNFECTSNFCVERKCISGTLIQKILSWFSDLFRPR